MDSNFFEDEQFNNNTWDEYSDNMVCPSPLLLGHPQIKKFNNEDELSPIHLQYHTDTLDDDCSQQNQPSQPSKPLIKKKLHKSHKRTSSKKNQNSPSVSRVLNNFATCAKLSGDNTTQQIQYCQQMQQLIDNLEGILSKIKSRILNSYKKQINQKN
ncbi:unnamed protein product (macronuclear) [Paramecium tetraurelia]|uniref:BHLH domain-containing protein n=1 Tax=Paramecium tetraurelia TaxID=5888 RepID=A0C7S8_PARTE|nr:uncharacterized protein GSPATT00035976001 [Paramecium tetraurelia]CAK66845.1 unnamed protein product [Paramecium tetraurelia]|eukprot:XP_001434242.1 hypothetical protein (macronuclear) [Paramecium tetraurelia strain d4-2]